MTRLRTRAQPSEEDRVDWTGGGPDLLAPRLARRVVVVVLSAIALVGTLNAASDHPSPAKVVLCLVVVGAVLTLQLRFFSRRVLQFPSIEGYLALALEAPLVYLPFFMFGQSWVGIPGFFAGSVLLALDGAVAWWAWGAVILSVATIQAYIDFNPGIVLYSVISTVITGLVVYALCWLASLVQQLQLARTEFAAMAVTQERIRFASDLHDLLGYSLSAITLKSELARRLIEPGHARAATELDEILDLSRQALSDVRSVATGFRNMSLLSESQSVHSVLRSADIAVTMAMDQVDLPDQVSTVLAAVLREGATNVLRHSEAKNCHVGFSQVGPIAQLRLANDGVTVRLPTTGDSRTGSGIESLSVRMTSIGGSLRASVEDSGWYVLCAEVRLAP